MKVIMSELILSIGVSSVLVGVERELCMGAATFPRSRKRHYHAPFSLLSTWSWRFGGWTRSEERCLGSSESNVPTSQDISLDLTVLTSIDSVDMSVTSVTCSCIGLGAISA